MRHTLENHLKFSPQAMLVIASAVSVGLLFSVVNMGSAEEEDEVTKPDLQFYAAPLSVVKKEKIRLDWESEGADYCTASGAWSGKKEPTGSVLVPAKKTGTYKIQCFDEEGVASKKIARKITVVASKKKLKRKKLSTPTPKVGAPSHAAENEQVTIAWSSPKGTVACRASGPDDWAGLKAPRWSDSFSAEIGLEYALSCWNENGQEGKRVTHVFKQKPKVYTATSVGLGTEYFPLYPDDFMLADGSVVFFIDFVKKEERSPDTDQDDLYYFGKRIVINPYINTRVEDKDVLKQLHALSSQVPPDVASSSKLINATENIGAFTPMDDLVQFKNVGEYSHNGEIPTIAFDDFERLAIDGVLEYLDLPREDLYRQLYTTSIPAIWFNGLTGARPMFIAVDVYNKENDAKPYRTILMDPYTGETIASEIVESMFAVGIWDRTIMKVREPEGAQLEPSPSVKDEPVANPPTQTPVVPPSEPTKEELKIEETTKKCSSGFIWSPTLGQCYEDTSAKQNSEAKPACTTGYSYSITLKTCVKD